MRIACLFTLAVLFTPALPPCDAAAEIALTAEAYSCLLYTSDAADEHRDV